MTPDAFNINDLGVGGVLLLIVIIIGVFAFLKGFVALIFNLIAALLGITGGYWFYENGITWISKVIADPSPLVLLVSSVIIGAGFFVLARNLLNLMLNPLSENFVMKKIGVGIPGTIISVLFGAGFFFLLAIGIRYVAGSAEVSHLLQVQEGKSSKEKTPLIVSLKEAIDQSRFGTFLEKVDFLDRSEVVDLAKLCLIKDDPSALAEHEKKSLLNHPAIQSFIKESSALDREALQKDISLLLKNPQLLEAAKKAARDLQSKAPPASL